MTEIFKNKVVNVAMDQIRPNSYQPRENFNEERLEELSKSIEENGILQPIILRKLPSGYEIIAGERRFRASKLLNYREISSIIIEAGDKESAKLALIENIQREDLNIIEEAEAFRQIIGEFKMTQDELARKIGKSRPYISNTMRLLDLDERVIGLMKLEKLTSGHGKLLLGVKDKDLQYEIAKNIVGKKLTIRQAKSLIDRLLNKKPKKNLHKDFYLKSLEDDLMMHFGTKVNLVKKKDKGIIEIEFYNEDDLGRILDILS